MKIEVPIECQICGQLDTDVVDSERLHPDVLEQRDDTPWWGCCKDCKRD